jgi:hypothetical protein
MTRVEQVGIIEPSMLVDFILGAEFLNEIEVKMSFKDRTGTQETKAKSDDMKF